MLHLYRSAVKVPPPPKPSSSLIILHEGTNMWHTPMLVVCHTYQFRDPLPIPAAMEAGWVGGDGEQKARIMLAAGSVRLSASSILVSLDFFSLSSLSHFPFPPGPDCLIFTLSLFPSQL